MVKYHTPQLSEAGLPDPDNIYPSDIEDYDQADASPVDINGVEYIPSEHLGSIFGEGDQPPIPEHDRNLKAVRKFDDSIAKLSKGQRNLLAYYRRWPKGQDEWFLQIRRSNSDALTQFSDKRDWQVDVYKHSAQKVVRRNVPVSALRLALNKHWPSHVLLVPLPVYGWYQTHLGWEECPNKAPDKVKHRRGINLRSKKEQLLFSWQEGYCHGCGHLMEQNANYHLDHVLPVDQGGCNCMLNLQLLCPGCNRLKRTGNMRVLWDCLAKEDTSFKQPQLWRGIKLRRRP